MKEKEPVSPQLPSGIKVEWSGLFDANSVYEKIKYWLDYNGFGDNFEEEEYSELVKGDSKNIGARWHAEKDAGGYFGYVIEINIFITGMRQTTINKDGIQLAMNTGKFQAKLGAYVVKDFSGKYKNTFMQKIYENLVAKSRLEEHKRLLAIKIYELQEEIKKFLTMP